MAGAARLLQRRLTSILSRDRSIPWRPQDFAWSSLRAIGVRDFQLMTGSADVATDASTEDAKACSDGPHVPAKLPETTISPCSEANVTYKVNSKLKTSHVPAKLPETTISHCSEANVTYTVNSKLKISPRHDLVMIFTCKVCEARSVKTACREAYEKGVVIARCGGCDNIHLMADHLGWFGEPGSVEELLEARGEEVLKGSLDTLNLTLDDLVGSRTKLPGSVEKLLAARGEEVRKGPPDTLNLTLDDLVGSRIKLPGSVEELHPARGEEVRKGSPDTLNLTLDDLAGSWTKLPVSVEELFEARGEEARKGPPDTLNLTLDD